MLDLCWLWEKKWWALWFQLRRRLGRKIPGAQEFLVNIVRTSLLKETNRCFICNSSHLPLWVPGIDLGLSSLHSRLSHVTGPLLGSLYPFFNVVFIKFICRNCFHFAYEIVIWEDELAEGLTGHFQSQNCWWRLSLGAAQAPVYAVLTTVFSCLQLLIQHWGSDRSFLGIWAIKMMIDLLTLPFYLEEVFKPQRLSNALIDFI